MVNISESFPLCLTPVGGMIGRPELWKGFRQRSEVSCSAFPGLEMSFSMEDVLIRSDDWLTESGFSETSKVAVSWKKKRRKTLVSICRFLKDAFEEEACLPLGLNYDLASV